MPLGWYYSNPGQPREEKLAVKLYRRRENPKPFQSHHALPCPNLSPQNTKGTATPG